MILRQSANAGCYSGYFSRNTFLSSLPTLVLGSTSTRTMRSGTPNFAWSSAPYGSASWS